MPAGKLRLILLVLVGLIVTGCGPTIGKVTEPMKTVSAVMAEPFLHVKDLSFMRGVPAAPIYQARSLSHAVVILRTLWKSSRPYTGTVPDSARSVTNAYWGPSVLTVTSAKDTTTTIYPARWIGKKGEGLVMHYIPNVLTVKMGSKIFYVTNPALYHWFAAGGWQSQF